MKGKYSVTVRFDIFQTLDKVEDVLDPHKIAEDAACEMADLLADHRAAVTFEVVNSNVEVQS